MITANQLIAHAVGDYVLQNHWMATRKTQSLAIATVHALVYSLPFQLFDPSLAAWLVIVSTHALIDHFRLAKLWTELWGVGRTPSGWYCEATPPPGANTHNDDWTEDEIERAPPFLGVWLLIIVDNVMHVLINGAALAWL